MQINNDKKWLQKATIFFDKNKIVMQTKLGGNIMNDNLFLGMAIGFVIGAILVHSNQKASNFIDESKQKIVETIEKV